MQSLDLSLPAAQQLVYSTFFGGSGIDIAQALAVDAADVVTFGGYSSSPNLPVTAGAFGTTLAGNSDAFVARLDPSRAAPQQIVYSTLLGGAAFDGAAGVARRGDGGAVVAGRTDSTNFPSTPASFDPIANGAADAFVALLDLLPAGVARFGRGSPGCSGSPTLAVSSSARVGNGAFSLVGANGPPAAVGAVVLSFSALAVPMVVLGVEVWIDPVGAPTVVVLSDARGSFDLPFPIANDPGLAGIHFFAQTFWLGPTAPPPCPAQGVSATAALDITIQP